MCGKNSMIDDAQNVVRQEQKFLVPFSELSSVLQLYKPSKNTQVDTLIHFILTQVISGIFLMEKKALFHDQNTDIAGMVTHL